MKGSVKYALLGLVAINLLVGCAPIYVPNYVNAPLLSNAGEVQGGISTGINGTDLYAAGSPIEHLGVMIDYSRANRQRVDGPEYHKHKSFEGAVGYYAKIGGAGRFECYGGYGQGYSESYGSYAFGGGNNSAGSNFYKITIQPAIGATTEVFDGAFVLRGNFVGLKNARYYDQGASYVLSGQSVFFLEPTMVMRVGYRYVKVSMQGGLSLPLTDNYYFEHNPFILSIGLHLNFNRNWDEE